MTWNTISWWKAEIFMTYSLQYAPSPNTMWMKVITSLDGIWIKLDIYFNLLCKLGCSIQEAQIMFQQMHCMEFNPLQCKWLFEYCKHCHRVKSFLSCFTLIMTRVICSIHSCRLRATAISICIGSMLSIEFVIFVNNSFHCLGFRVSKELHAKDCFFVTTCWHIDWNNLGWF